MGRQQHRFHGDPQRFQVVAEYVAEAYGKSITHIADVAGGQGMLAKLLAKHHYVADVIDPRGWTMKGVHARAETFDAQMADYYDLVIGLHPDEATRAVAEAALVRPAILVPCCNFWSDERLGRDGLLNAIEQYYAQRSVQFERVVFNFRGPKNIGIVSEPSPRRGHSPRHGAS